MNESEIALVDAQTLGVNFPSIGAAMTIRAEGNQVFILVRSTLGKRDDVVQFHLDVAACGDGTSVSSLNKDSPLDAGWNGWSPLVLLPVHDPISDQNPSSGTNG